MRKNAGELIESLVPLYESSRNETNPLDYIEILKNPAQVHRKFLELFAQTKKEIMGFSKPPYSYNTHKLKMEQIECNYDAVKRGITIKNIYDLPPTEEERIPWLEFISDLKVPGVEDRVIEDSLLKWVSLTEES